ncbi:P-loop containing nucleoside triphosphate hydrolase protein [Lineolata rhizophorae]|uniref:Myosin-1 n=1 Tax=Lineolata rhizophorae TaxID=578093 RepID=A0A6A6P7N7_9PEZI|nr:P-loop containing nucleoside triphosphate hydrolase protein [Lineolata rhizophorae]
MSVHADPPPALVNEPTTIQYATGSQLGKGGFAICHRAELLDNGKPTGQVVALKIVKSKMEPAKLAQKFVTELQIHSKLHHPNIVEFYRAFSFQQNTYVVLEICENGSLADALKKRKYFTMPEIRRFIIQTCGAVKYLHHRHIIHRDLKTGNLFLDRNMNIKVGDFGLAAVLMSQNDIGSRRTTMCGTPNYLAPEILEKGGKGHNEKVDLWAIGIIAYTLAVGRAPFHAAKREDIYKKLQAREYKWPDVDREISNDLRELVGSLLVHEDDRPNPDQIVSHPFFKMTFVPEHLDSNCTARPPKWSNPPPSIETKRRGYSESWYKLCKESGVGEYEPGRCFPICGGRKVKSVVKDFEKEVEQGNQPVIPIPKGTVYEADPERSSWSLINGNNGVLSDIVEEKESSAESRHLVETKGNQITSHKGTSRYSAPGTTSFSAASISRSVERSQIPHSDPASVLEKVARFRDNIAEALTTKHATYRRAPFKQQLPFVSKWVDYSGKHGVGYVLEDGSIGCIMNATSKHPVTHVVVRNGYSHLKGAAKESNSMEKVPLEFLADCGDEGIKAVSVDNERRRAMGVLWFKFGKYMCQQLGQADGRVDSSDSEKKISFVRFYQRVGGVGVWGFGDGSFQFNFPDHTKLVLSADGKFCNFTCLSKEAALHLVEHGDLPFAYIREREVLSLPVQTLLYGFNEKTAFADVMEANFLREKLEYIVTITDQWVTYRGLGCHPPGAEKKLKWRGPQLDDGKKSDWVTVGRFGKKGVKKAVFETSKKKEVGVSDLTLLSQVSNEAINDNLRKRFEAHEIYTYIGHVLVSVNPFQDLGIYTDEVLESYKGKNRLEVPPHVFAIAESAYYNMNAYKDNQCIIISGESGAGKTEAAKRIMQYIANVSGGSSSNIQEIKDMVLATNPLLESFGNAKTLRNNNSSRFGKYLEIHFNAQGEPVGANIKNYLLEKSRVVGQIRDERNFHIFYQFTKAASQSHRELFGVQPPTSYTYTSRSKCYDVAGIDDHADYQDTLNAMRVIGLPQSEQDDIFRMLSAILWLGNVQFRENDEGYAAITDQSVVDFVAYLLEVDPAHVNKALTTRVVETSRGGRRGSVYDVPLNPAQAGAVRDALAKGIYFNMFDWIVSRVNVSLQARGASAHTIGILDIYGFEIFERNSFEQLCINYVNEKLQQIFIQLTLKAEQEEYANEGIKWTPIKYFDNKVVCQLIEERRPAGVFATLNDACATAHADPAAADQTFAQRLNMLSSNPNFEHRQGQFIVKHYAGDVAYAIDGMTDKNKDQLLKDLLILVGQSSNRFVHTLFPEQVDTDNKRRPPTAGDKIKVSANDLFDTLMQASPSYIRTIKPNEKKSPKEYNSPNVLHQIKYLGLQENVRIRRAGFAYRQTYEKFLERFYLLSPKTSYAGECTWQGDDKSGVKQILHDCAIAPDEHQMGRTKVFIKTPETLFSLETLRDRYWVNMAIRIQRAWRNYLRYRAESAARIQRFWRRKKGELALIQLRDYGHQVLGGRKERRRMSLLGSRRFLGDYIGVANTGGFGEPLRNAIGSGEQVVFSCRCEVLVSKLGRSSKPEGRYLVLTQRTVYIIKQVLLNKQIVTQAERTIPLGAIRFVSTSNLKDDWFALGVGSPQEPDPLISCVFKTEFFTYLARMTQPDLRIGEMIQYNKKPNKPATIQAIKDPAVPRDDVYKSGKIHTGPGEPPNSRSKPTPRGKQVSSKPITKGKLIRAGGPGGGQSKLTSRPAQPRSTPSAASQQHQQQSRPVPQPGAALNGPSHNRNLSSSTSAARGPPPPPPAAPPAVQEARYRALYDFAGQTSGELSLTKDEVVVIDKKEPNGWWLAHRTTDSKSAGWTPAAYLEEVVSKPAAPPPPPAPPAASRAVPTPPTANGSASAGGIGGSGGRGAKPGPPVPPAKRPVARQKPAPPPAPRDSGYSGSGASGTETPRDSGGSIAGGLAEALRARQAAMHAKKTADEDDW